MPRIAANRRPVNSFRICTKCGNIYPLSEFYKRGTFYKEDGKPQYKSHCKNCIRNGDISMIRDELHLYEIITATHAIATVTYCVVCASFLENEGKEIIKLDEPTEDTRCYFYRHKELKTANKAKTSGSAQNP